MFRRIGGQLNYANVMVTGLAFIVLGGGAYAVSTAPRNSVKSSSIKDKQVKNADLGSSAVTGAKVADNSLTGADINEATLQGQPIRINRTASDDTDQVLVPGELTIYNYHCQSDVMELDLNSSTGITANYFGFGEGAEPSVTPNTISIQNGAARRGMGVGVGNFFIDLEDNASTDDAFAETQLIITTATATTTLNLHWQHVKTPGLACELYGTATVAR